MHFWVLVGIMPATRASNRRLMAGKLEVAASTTEELVAAVRKWLISTVGVVCFRAVRFSQRRPNAFLCSTDDITAPAWWRPVSSIARASINRAAATQARLPVGAPPYCLSDLAATGHSARSLTLHA